MGSMTLLHASLKEYLIFFGTPIGTEGHSGRYVTEVYDFVMQGEMWCYHEGEFERKVYKPGDAAYLGTSKAKGYCIKDSAWMLEYGRGPIPTMLPFGLADSIFSTLDLRTTWKTFYNYGRLVTKSLRTNGR
jgi:C-8 sterol isomerase